MATPATLDHLRLFVIGQARKIGRGFTKPDEDWAQVAFIQSPGGLDVVMLSGENFRDGLSKDVLGETLRRYVQFAGAYRYVVLLNAHITDEDDPPTPEQIEGLRSEQLHVAQLEGSKEVLILLVGDAEEEQLWMAPIGRSPRTATRTMGKWEREDVKEGRDYVGRFRGLNAYMREPKQGG